MSSQHKPPSFSYSIGTTAVETSVKGGIPTPVFLEDSSSLTRKRTRSIATPRTFLPPRSPIKSAQPISRVFRRREDWSGPRSVGTSGNGELLKTPHYSVQSTETYFDQCFIVEEKLGVGSFGEVFKVKSKEDGKQYAVKISRQGFRGEMDRSCKLQEVSHHEGLTPHPNCVLFYNAWEEGGHLYIQTELCQQSLKAYCDQFHGPMDEAFVWRCLADLALGLRHIHNVHLGHFDIKPENIFISGDGVCKIGDFGLMLDLSNNDFHEAQEGDPKYLAPELLQGGFDKPADIFSLGLTILELACDVDLPGGDEAWHALRRGSIPPGIMQHLSPELRELILSMLNPNPNSRPSVYELLQNPFLAAVAAQREKQALVLRIGHYTGTCVRQLWHQVIRFFWFLVSFLTRLQTDSKLSATPISSSSDTSTGVSSLPAADSGVQAPGSEDSFHPQLSSSFTEATPSRAPPHSWMIDSIKSNSRSELTDQFVGDSPFVTCRTKAMTSPFIQKDSIQSNSRSELTDQFVSNSPFVTCRTKTMTSPLIPNGSSLTAGGTPRTTTLPIQRLIFDDHPNKYSGSRSQLGPKNLLDDFEDVSD